MTNPLDLTGLREFVTSTLDDDSLQTLFDDAFSAIDDAIGPEVDAREYFSPHGDLLMLSRRAQSITEVIENTHSNAPQTLDPSDYALRPSGRTLVRLRTGRTPRYGWRGRVDVAYEPFDLGAARIRVAVELVKLEISYQPGLQAQTIGTWSEAYQRGDPYDVQRAAILASLNPSDGII